MYFLYEAQQLYYDDALPQRSTKDIGRDFFPFQFFLFFLIYVLNMQLCRMRINTLHKEKERRYNNKQKN